ncbi:MAG: tetratricopeptide repeat protein [Candidatus Heimdallarchaeota archaeon]|nr:tetratricopeptide repeat protein [Candidatus Heimdallarchaeota archaeon]MCK4953863.1 tetratricopeptide repeat protein [Candidatus Heimdallarchaeota archaeon]
MGSEKNEDSKKFEVELIESLIDNGLYDEAISYLDRLIERYEEDTYILHLKGKTYYLNGKFNQAIEELTTVIALDSDFWMAFELLGEIYRSTNQPELAETYYFKATAINPRAMKSWLGRGKLALQRGEFQIAVLSFETYLRTNNEEAEVWRLLGRSYRELQNYISSIDSYNEAIDVDPTHQGLYEELGDLYLSMGHPDIAKEKYLQGLQVEEKTRPISKELYHKLANLYLEEGLNQKAFNLCNELLIIAKDDSEALFISGKALVKLGQNYEGIQLMKKAFAKTQKSEYKEYLEELNRQLYSPR